jgi:SAM-dependent methyltransferase
LIRPHVDFISLSKRRKIPVFHSRGYEYYPWDLLRIICITRNWKILSNNGASITFQVDRVNLTLLPKYANMMLREYLEWSRYYLPESLIGKTVLDVGAGCGETAAFYFNHGAKKVIAIEPDPLAFSYLQLNMIANDWNVALYNDYLSVKHLHLDYDFAKLDCEGGEKLLMEYLPKIPIRLEAHGLELQASMNSIGFELMKQKGKLALMKRE